jgi:polyhydroxyalkanoate synthesis regulator phasin
VRYEEQMKKKEGKSQKPVEADVPNATKIILEDIEEFTNKTEQAAKEEIKTITTTEYVRLIKHKSKVLYEFTQKGSARSNEDKNRVKDLYKRLRTVLKEIDKVNQTKIESKVTSSE